jgi:hypothetical protein
MVGRGFYNDMTETEEVKAIYKWFLAEYPEYEHCWRVSTSGMNLGGGKRAAIMIKFLRSIGVSIGESDISILLPSANYGSLVIEHKAEGSAHKATDEQIEYIDAHNETGNLGIITRGIGAAQAAIRAYIDQPCQSA